MQPTLWHPKNCQHEIYGMTCEQYEGLRKRAGDLCEICRTPWHPLAIDHDHKARTGFPDGVYEYARGWAGVRGLICPKCNSHMRFVDCGDRPVDERTARYLANAWHLHNLPAETFPTPNPEPPVGTVVLAERRYQWRRREAGWFRTEWRKSECRPAHAKTWLYLSYYFGPEHLQVIRTYQQHT